MDGGKTSDESDRKNMRVLFISDFGLQHTHGGAQRSNDIIIKKGTSRGHDVQLFTYDGDVNLLNSQYDIVVSSNLEIISSTLPQLVSSIPKLSNHVRLEHDSNTYWDDDFREYFWGSCKKSFFLTEFHHEFFVEFYGDIFPNVSIVPDPIDFSFRKLPITRGEKIGYVGFMHHLKGTNNFIQTVRNNPNKQFMVAGWGDKIWTDQITSLPNVEFCNKIDHLDMPVFYNSIESLYYDPVCYEPFCRSVGEALMCETPITTSSQRIGSLEMRKALSYEDFRSQCINAADKFWEEIECL